MKKAEHLPNRDSTRTLQLFTALVEQDGLYVEFRKCEKRGQIEMVIRVIVRVEEVREIDNRNAGEKTATREDPKPANQQAATVRRIHVEKMYFSRTQGKPAEGRVSTGKTGGACTAVSLEPTM